MLFLKNIFVALLLIATFIGTSVEGRNDECHQPKDCAHLKKDCEHATQLARDEGSPKTYRAKCVWSGVRWVCRCLNR
ncbi:unnamed protein product [Callosobruchus maculatus]|uniref:Uncharacterized protein n=1 Tax=Callosobruchus maculatus TaxID=64391 RepID=A0A653CGM6_CALMS|nr:unnamed protein product [Callosobruchus maculatus]